MKWLLNVISKIGLRGERRRDRLYGEGSDQQEQHEVHLPSSRLGKSIGIVPNKANDTNCLYIDTKPSISRLSKTKAKKHLKRAGLRPSEANALMREVAGKSCVYQSASLADTMRHHKRLCDKWFPWDTFIPN